MSVIEDVVSPWFDEMEMSYDLVDGIVRYVAAHIPGAQFVELPGDDHLPWFGDADAVHDVITAFLAER